MNKSIKLLHDKVMFLKAEVVLKSQVDESVYKTPTALTSELEVGEESQDNTMTFPTSKGQEQQSCRTKRQIRSRS